MNKKLILLLVVIMSFSLLVGCDSASSKSKDETNKETADKEETDNEETGKADVIDVSDEYAYLVEKGLSGDELKIAIELNEYFGKVYDEQLIMWVEYSDCDGPIAYAIDISDFAKISKYSVEPDWYDPDTVMASTARCVYLDIDADGDGINDITYCTPGCDNAGKFKKYYNNYADVYGSLEDDINIYLQHDEGDNLYYLYWGHTYTPEQSFVMQTYYCMDISPTAKDFLNADETWLVDKVTILTTPKMVYEQ